MADIIESATVVNAATHCDDVQVVVSYRVSSPLCLTVLAAKSGD